MKHLFTCLLLVIICQLSSAQLFNKTWKSKQPATQQSDSVYFLFTDSLTTADPGKPVYHYTDTVTGYRYELPKCKCIDMTSKKPGDVIVISRSLLDAMTEAAKKYKKSKRSIIEN
jgi:hypothetical protein